MAHFVVLGKWTSQGVAAYKDTVARSDAVDKMMKSNGGRVVDIYWTLGKYDFVAVMEAPDDATMTAILLRIGAQGNVSTATMRAFDKSEMKAVIAKASA